MDKYKRYLYNIGENGLNEEQQNKLINSKVVVMGAGALGSAVISNLISLGVENIKIVDNEILKETDFNCGFIHKYSNVGRARVISAKEWIQEYNPNVKVEIEKVKFNELNYYNVIQGYDIIVDCFENAMDQTLLNQIAVSHNKVLIHAQAKGFNAHVTTIVPPTTGCLGCLMTKPELYNLADYNFISPVVNIIASIQANEALKVIIGSGELLTDRLLCFDGLRNEFKIVTYSKSLACDVCANSFSLSKFSSI